MELGWVAGRLFRAGRGYGGVTGPDPANGLCGLYAGWADALERDLAILTVVAAVAGVVG